MEWHLIVKSRGCLYCGGDLGLGEDGWKCIQCGRIRGQHVTICARCGAVNPTAEHGGYCRPSGAETKWGTDIRRGVIEATR